jgi:hypothetical protein
MSDGLFQLTPEQEERIKRLAEETMPPEMKKLLQRAEAFTEELKELKSKRMTGIELITNERLEQKVKHGHSIRNDFENNMDGELAQAAAALLEGNISWMPENWDHDICKKMVEKPFEQRLVIAGALIAAEIDRLNYKP